LLSVAAVWGDVFGMPRSDAPDFLKEREFPSHRI